MTTIPLNERGYEYTDVEKKGEESEGSSLGYD